MSKNDITMDTLRTRGPSKEYDEGYARIFGTKIPQAECAPREAQPKLTVWYGSLPESNGKTNWTAILHRGDVTEGITIDISEYPDRTRYEADRMRWMIGELADEPWILDYDADKHSGYAAPTPVPAPREAHPLAYLVDLEDRILVEFERRALGFPLRIDGVPNLNGVRIIECVRTILDTLSAKQQPVWYVSDMDLALLKRNRRAADLFVKPGERCDVPLYAPTPDRAQPVGPRTTLNYDGTFDTTCAHCGGNGCFACLKSAAPTPERSDAEKDAAIYRAIKTQRWFKRAVGETFDVQTMADFEGAILAADKEKK
jgi:hypothetical protein